MALKFKGIKVEFGDQALVIPPLCLGALEDLQGRIAKFQGDIGDKDQVATVIDAALMALNRNYPEITRKDVASMIDVGNMAEVFEAVMDVSQLKRKAIEAGEVTEPRSQ